jgi:hypothetical protein
MKYEISISDNAARGIHSKDVSISEMAIYRKIIEI